MTKSNGEISSSFQRAVNNGENNEFGDSYYVAFDMTLDGYSCDWEHKTRVFGRT